MTAEVDLLEETLRPDELREPTDHSCLVLVRTVRDRQPTRVLHLDLPTFERTMSAASQTFDGAIGRAKARSHTDTRSAINPRTTPRIISSSSPLIPLTLSFNFGPELVIGPQLTAPWFL